MLLYLHTFLSSNWTSTNVTFYPYFKSGKSYRDKSLGSGRHPVTMIFTLRASNVT